MNAAWLTLGSLTLLFVGYRWYSRFLARRVFHTETAIDMPSKVREDGVDYVPTPKGILFGHHFASIAGAAPILGPAIAVTWGWLPALLWVVLGAVFMGAVHDYGALVLSVRHGGKSIGTLCQDILGARAKYLFLSIIFLLVFVVIAVFAFVIAQLFVQYPSTVIPINFEILIAILMGKWARNHGKSMLLPSIAALISLYVMTYVGFIYPITLPPQWCIGGSATMTWVAFLMGYGWLASVLPVRTLLQPRDYINSHQLIVGLAAIYIGIFVTQPEMDAPAVYFEGNPLPWFPFLFITIACGAISGFHALVASGTTSKQLTHLRDARPIGYGSMIGEATLAVAATIAVAAGFENSAAWHAHYGDFAAASGLGAKLFAFVEGTAGFLQGIGLDQVLSSAAGQERSLAAVLISVLVISFAATSLDTAIRVQRYVIGELSQGLRIPLLSSNRYVQAALAVALSFMLLLSGKEGSGGLALWPLFGTTNQLLGALTLLVISVWLRKQQWPVYYTLIPMIIITVITWVSSYYNIHQYYASQQWMLLVFASTIVLAQGWILFEGFQVYKRQAAG